MRAIVLLLLVLASPWVAARSRSISHTDWVVDRDQVTVRVVIPIAATWRMVAAGLPPPSSEKVAAYLLEHLGVQAAGSACEPIDQGYDIGRVNTLAAAAGLLGFEIIFHCPGIARPILKNSILFERMPQHIDYARIEIEGTTVAQLFTARRQALDLGVSLKSAGPTAFANLGAGHIVHGAERLCFLLGLILLMRNRRDAWLAVAGLSCGYLASLAVLGLGLVPHMPSLESAIGLLVALCAAHWVARQARTTRWTALSISVALVLVAAALGRLSSDIAWTLLGAAIFSGSFIVISCHRPALALFVVSLLFATLDGVVLWGDFTRLQLWQMPGSGALLAFNAGACLSELGIMAVLYGGTRWWARSRRRAAFNSVAGEIAATALAGSGAFWLLIQLKGG